MIPLTLTRNGEEYVGSVSVASPDALVVIEEMAMADSDTLLAYAVVTEDIDGS